MGRLAGCSSRKVQNDNVRIGYLLLGDKLVFSRLEKNMRHKWGVDRV
ncbi:MAG TPA: hypothetical protein VIM42_03325 [Clostridium sp.]